jgi:A/G-specific adenine glycosylase
MLQQTQVSRVVEPWEKFLKAFPTPTRCADASLAEVLKLWGGLGFSRRAKALHETSKMIRDQHKGKVPSTVEELRTLKGVGEYTANAIASFAFGVPVAILDTNVGRILSRGVANKTLTGKEARVLVNELLPKSDTSQFNQAMLDLGAQFCKSKPLCEKCPVAKSCAWKVRGGKDPATKSAGVSKPQSAFKGSDRQVRGQVLAQLRIAPASIARLRSLLNGVEPTKLQKVLNGLMQDGLIERRGRMMQLHGE